MYRRSAGKAYDNVEGDGSGGGGVKLPNGSVAYDMFTTTDGLALSRIPIGAGGQVLTVVGGAPVWAPVAASQTPWVSNIDAGGYKVFDLSQANFTGPIRIGQTAAEATGGTDAVAIGPAAAADVANAVAIGNIAHAFGLQCVSVGDSTGPPAFGGTYGAGNTCVGSFAGNSLTTGADNTLLGRASGNSLTTGSNNTTLGVYAGISQTTADSNVLVGKSAGSNITTGSANTCIGLFADVLVDTANNVVSIGAASRADTEGVAVGPHSEARQGQTVLGYQTNSFNPLTTANALVFRGSGNGAGVALPDVPAAATRRPFAYNTSTGQAGPVALGTALQVLRTNAAANDIEWAAPGGSQTPWTSNIDAAMNKVINLTQVNFNGPIRIGHTFAETTGGTDAVAIGSGAVAEMLGGIAIGRIAAAYGPGNDPSIAIGYNAIVRATATGTGIAIGNNADAVAAESLALGRFVTANGAQSVVIGAFSSSRTAGAGNAAVSIGYTAKAGPSCVAIGNSAEACPVSGSIGVAIGKYAFGNDQAVAIGTQARALNNGCFSIGYQAGPVYTDVATAGVHNLAFGFQALKELTTGSNNLAIGQQSIANVTTGGGNVAVGATSLVSLTTNGGNVGIGEAVMNFCTGGFNTGIGSLAGNLFVAFPSGHFRRAEKGFYNTLVGRESTVYHADASYATTIGYKAVAGPVTGVDGSGNALDYTDGMAGVAVGVFAHAFGVGCVSVGEKTGPPAFSGTYGAGNTCVGSAAGSALTTGANNTFLGRNAGVALTTGSSNTMLGVSAGQFQTTGSNNILVGTSAGNAITTGSSNTCIGVAANVYAGTANSGVAIGFASAADTEGVAVGTYSLARQGQTVLGYNTNSSTPLTTANALVFRGSGNGAGVALPDVPAAATRRPFAYNTSTGQAGPVALGTALQVLRTNATGDDIEWAAPGGSQTPWTSNIDAASYKVFDLTQTNFTGPIRIGQTAAEATGGTDAVAIGPAAAANGVSGVAIGKIAHAFGTDCVSVGASTGPPAFGGTYGAGNTCVGSAAGNSLTTGADNTLLGRASGVSLTTGLNNTMLGVYAGLLQTTADSNVLVGRSTGTSIISGSHNTCIGQGANVLAGTANYVTCIGAASAADTEGVAVGRQSSARQGQIVLGYNTNSNNPLTTANALVIRGLGNGAAVALPDVPAAATRRPFAYDTSTGQAGPVALGTALQVLRTNAAANDIEWGTVMANPMTTTGDTIYGAAAGVPTRLGIGATGEVLTVSGGGLPSWAAVAGFADPTTTVGDMMYKDNSGMSLALLRLAAPGTNTARKVLGVEAGMMGGFIPAWKDFGGMTTSGDMTYLNGSGVPTRLPIGTQGQVLKVDMMGAPEWAAAGGAWTANQDAGGFNLIKLNRLQFANSGGTDKPVLIGNASTSGSGMADGEIVIGQSSTANTIMGGAQIILGNSNTGKNGKIILGHSVAAGADSDAVLVTPALRSANGTAVHQLGTGELTLATSSARFKDNIEPVGAGWSDKLHALRPVHYTRKADPTRALNSGLIAEEVQPLFPEMVPLDTEGLPFSVDYAALVVPLIAEVQKLKRRLDELESEQPATAKRTRRARTTTEPGPSAQQ